MKIKSLANYCFDLRFYKPRIEQVRGAMMSIGLSEIPVYSFLHPFVPFFHFIEDNLKLIRCYFSV